MSSLFVRRSFPKFPYRRHFFAAMKSKNTSETIVNTAEIKEKMTSGNKIFKDNPHWAVNKYSDAIKLNSECHISHVNRAYAYLEINEIKTAIEDAEKAVEIAPLDATTHIAAGVAHMRNDSYEKALDSFYMATDLTCPSDPRYDITLEMGFRCRRKMKGEPEIQPVQQSIPTPQPQQVVSSTEPQNATNPSPTNEEIDNLPPFQDPEFVKTQQEISTKMFELGDDEFKQRMEQLSQLPELQEFQRKIMNGEKPSMKDYYKLYNEPTGQFAKFANNLAKMQNHPDLGEFAQIAATGDWNSAFSKLKDSPKAMKAYMELMN